MRLDEISCRLKLIIRASKRLTPQIIVRILKAESPFQARASAPLQGAWRRASSPSTSHQGPWTFRTLEKSMSEEQQLPICLSPQSSLAWRIGSPFVRSQRWNQTTPGTALKMMISYLKLSFRTQQWVMCLTKRFKHSSRSFRRSQGIKTRAPSPSKLNDRTTWVSSNKTSKQYSQRLEWSHNSKEKRSQ